MSFTLPRSLQKSCVQGQRALAPVSNVHAPAPARKASQASIISCDCCQVWFWCSKAGKA